MAARQRERRRRAHERAQHREERRERRRGRRRILKWVVGGFVGFIFLLIVISLIIPPNLDLSTLGAAGSAASAEEGGEVQIQGKFEIERGESHQPYNSFPPTSGWYYAIPTEDIVWGVHDEPIVEEEQVSYLVRGGVLVQYNCAIECPSLVRNLERVVDNYPEAVIMAPYENMPSTVALTAWGWIDAFEENEFSEARVNDFILTHIGQGPDDFR